MSWLGPLIELLSAIFRKVFPPQVTALKESMQSWYRGAVERQALRQKEEKDGTPKS